MPTKYFLLNEIANFLAKKEYEFLITSGCFDLVARKKSILLIKILTNIDSIIEEQARNLRSISYFTSAYPIIISEKSNRNKLKDEIVYSRFQLPVITPQTFKKMINDFIPKIEARRGKFTVDIDVENLRRSRKELDLSLEKLSRKVSISKKALYEIEKKRVNPTLETVEKLEKFLKTDLKTPYKMKEIEKIYVEPKNRFQAKISSEFFRLGIDNSPVTAADFEIVGRRDFSLIAGLLSNTSKIKKKVLKLRSISSIFSSEGFFVAKKSYEKAINGVPILLDSELSELGSSEDLSKLIKERSET